jgi:hypothetical protein
MKKVGRETAHRKLSAGDWRVLQHLPDDVDVELAMSVVRKSLPKPDEKYPSAAFGHYLRFLPLPVLRAAIAELRALQTPSPAVRLVLATLDENDLPGSWHAILTALADLDTTYTWGSAKHKEKIALVAGQPRIVDALQGVVVSLDHVPNAWRAVLIAEGSEASVDALLPAVNRAFADGGSLLEGLDYLRPFVATPVMAQLLRENAEKLAERRSKSPALAFAERIGLPPRKRFHFRASINSREEAFNVSKVQGRVEVDSDDVNWFSLHLSLRTAQMSFDRTSFSTAKVWSDHLKLGTCEADGVPEYLASAAKKLGVQFECTYIASSERGKNRELILRWLFPSQAPTSP